MNRSEPPGCVEPVTYVITNFNGRDSLGSTLQTLFQNAPSIAQVIVVDDGSTDGSRDWLKEHHPTVRVIGPSVNSRNVNYIRNLGLREATTRFVFLMDNDIGIQPGCVERMLQVATADPRVHCLTPRLVNADDPDTLFADGSYLHYLGLSGRTLRNQRIQDRPIRAPEPTFGCGIMLINMDSVKQVGPFDEGYLWGWGEDAEFQLRGRLFGFRSLYVSDAVCTHESKIHGSRRAFAQMCNRYRLILTVYSMRSLILLAPGLLIFETALTAAGFLKGFWRERFGALAHAWKQRADLRKRRRFLQEGRKVRDGELIGGGPFDLPGMMLDRRWVARLSDLLSAITQINWVLVRKLL